MQPFSRRPLVRIVPGSFAIGGGAAVGKTSATTILAERNPELQIVRGGKKMRDLGATRGYVGDRFDEFVKLIPHHPEWNVDNLVDAYIHDEMRFPGKILDARMNALADLSFQVLLEGPLRVCGTRRQTHPDYQKYTVEQNMHKLLTRNCKDWMRLMKKYPGCKWPRHRFDLVIDTSENNQEQVVDLIEAGYVKWLKANASLVDWSLWPYDKWRS